jgi:uncharacterized repeat protein (TIGR01451 family)
MARLRSRIFTSLTILFLVFSSFFSGSTALASPPKSPTNSINSSPAGQIDSGGILTIPYNQAPPTLDGSCTEYIGAVSQTFTDGNGQPGIVYLMHNNIYLYVCIAAQPGTNPERFASLYLDPDGNGSNYIFAQQDDFAFHTSLTGARTSFRGSGIANGYIVDPSLDPQWAAGVNVGAGGDGFEYRLQFDGLGFGFGCRLFGIATYHHWFAFTGDDYGWPSNQWFDQPRTWQLARLYDPQCTDLPGGPVAYVYRGNTADATSYYNLLFSAGYMVTLVPLSEILTTDFNQFNLILIAEDSGSLDQWGTGGLTDSQVAQITSANKPIIGLGEGGYAFFGRVGLFIGWPQGWHGPQDSMFQSGGPLDPFFFGVIPNPVQTYLTATNSVGIYLGVNGYPGDVEPIGLENPTSDHSSLILQGCRLLWGNSGNPYGMTNDGKTVFLNGVNYMRLIKCPTPPPQQCISIVKVADPPAGSTVTPGQVIHYTLTVTLSSDPSCDYVQNAVAVDYVPSGTTFIPGSASDGISPGADGALVWNFPISFSSPEVVKEFSVVVDNSACTTAIVANSATVQIPGIDPYRSNLLTHKVECPPIGLPHQQPDFAEEEISVNPYPLIVGHPSIVRVRISNFTSSNQPVTVDFQTSPDHFGIGLSYSTFDSKSVIIPASGNVIVEGTLTPAASGHWCIQIVVTGPALTEPLVTQSNLDVTENLVAGVPDTLTFTVGNPTPSVADIQLVVDNTCPGWNAAITNPAGGLLPSMAPNEVREAAMTVTPPNPVVLGSGCHIDVQGWIGNTMIGGIRKLDVPPVHLPRDIIPPWEEPEISFNPNPPVVGSPNQFCIQLQNPLAVAVAVNLDYAIADFGAGIGFTPVGSQLVTLPPNSIANYCITWIPSTAGTLHRCALVTLHQNGYQDETSQRNVDVVRVRPLGLGGLDIPFFVGNPDLITHTLSIDPIMFGIDPFWHVQIFFHNPGDPPPDILGPGETLMLHLGFMGGGIKGVNFPAAPFALNGDSSRVEVGILLDGMQVGGFTIELAYNVTFLPVINR